MSIKGKISANGSNPQQDEYINDELSKCITQNGQADTAREKVAPVLQGTRICLSKKD